jgi:hypothetical protein
MTGRSWLVLALGVATAIPVASWFYARSMTAAGPADPVVVIDGPADRRPPSSATMRSVELRPPQEVVLALHLPPDARLKAPLSPDATGSIACGEVSGSGGATPYRRFVFNRAGGTGAIDDGTDLFRRFADKICRQAR